MKRRIKEGTGREEDRREGRSGGKEESSRKEKEDDRKVRTKGRG